MRKRYVIISIYLPDFINWNFMANSYGLVRSLCFVGSKKKARLHTYQGRKLKFFDMNKTYNIACLQLSDFNSIVRNIYESVLAYLHRLNCSRFVQRPWSIINSRVFDLIV